MSSLMQPYILAPLLAFVSVASLVIAIFYPLGESEANPVRRYREHLRADGVKKTSKNKASEKREINKSMLDLMRSAVKKMNMDTVLESDGFRKKMARAGYRDRKTGIVFVFAQIALPLIFMAAVAFYYFVIQGEYFKATRHGLFFLVAAAVGYYLPAVLLKNATAKRQKEMRRAYPDALDLMVICVEAGMPVERAFQRVNVEIAPQSMALSEELGITAAELSFVTERRIAYENFAMRTGLKEVESLSLALIQSDKYGTPVAEALRVLAEESRTDRMTLAEAKAAKLPAQMTVPMIIFILPTLFAIVLGPAIVGVMGIDT